MSGGVIRNGVPWFDDRGLEVNAHGGCVLTHEGRYYLFGEYKADSGNRFGGFSCYSSHDLSTWRWEGLALDVQQDGPLGPERIGERVKVARCPSTGTFVMFAHSDDLGYYDPIITVATAEQIAGPYTGVRPLLHNGKPIRAWDVGFFQEDDGTGYVLLHEGVALRLADDYLAVESIVAEDVAPGGESPAMVKRGDEYLWLFSNKTHWDRNDNYYFSAPSIAGPWTHRGLVAPEGTLTWDSQCGHIFRLLEEHGGDAIYMGDRWSFPRQRSSATMVWLPLSDGDPLLPEFVEEWSLLGQAGSASTHAELAMSERNGVLHGNFRLASGGRVRVRGSVGPDSGYARITVRSEGGVSHEYIVNHYALVTEERTLLVSPILEADGYEVTIEPMGEYSEYIQKDGTRLGSTGDAVRITRVAVETR